MINLFNSRKFNELEIAYNSSVENRIGRMQKSEFENINIIEIAEEIYDQNKMSIPIIKESDIFQKQTKDVKIRRNLNYSNSYIDGTKYTLVIPFKGQSSMFTIFPSKFTAKLPYGEVFENEIHVIYEVPVGDNASEIKINFNRNLDLIKVYLKNLEEDIIRFNSQFKSKIKGSLESRKSKLDNDDKTANDLGFPIK